MTPDQKARLLKGLETYPQGTGSLRTPDGFCCLGVATDIFKTEVEGHWVPLPGNGNGWDFADGLQTQGSFLSPKMQAHLGFATDNGVLPFTDRNGGQMSLSEANDYGCNFAQISDLIRHFF